MHYLPKNSERRQQWIKNIERPDLDPAKDYYLCNIHFAADMWEKARVDGKQKLKSTAIPTIFQRKNKDMISSDNGQCSAAINTEDRPESEHEDVSSTLLVEECINDEVEIATHVSEAPKTGDLKMIIEKLQKSNRMLQKRIKKLTYEKRKLTVENRSLKANKSVNKLLNKDQERALHQKTVRGCKWSDDTMRKAIRLKLSCGSSGYEELLKQGVPLPAERTLRRRCEDFEFQPGICEQVFEILQQRVSKFADDREKDCMIALDEMSIMAGEQVYHGTMSHVGLSTLPDKLGK